MLGMLSVKTYKMYIFGHINTARVQLCATFANILLAGEEDLAWEARVGVGLGWAGLPEPSGTG